MTELEARCLVERWVQEYSPFATHVMGIRPGRNGSWVVVIECSTEIEQLAARHAGNAAPDDGEHRH